MMSKYIYLLIILIFMVPVIISADSTTNFTEKQVLNRVFDQTSDVLKTDIGGAGGVVTVVFDGTQPVSIEGITFDNVTLEVTFPAVQTVDFDGAQPVSGTVAVSNLPVSQTVDGTFWQTTQPVSGTFWQTTQPVSGAFYQTTQPVSGDFYPATQPVSGDFYPVTQPISGTVEVNMPEFITVEFDGTQPVTLDPETTIRTEVVNYPTSTEVSNFPDTQEVTVGNPVEISNFPATQPVSGSISVSNLPVTQPVSGTFYQTTQPVSGTVAVSNLPTNQNVKQVDTWGDELQKPAGFTGAMTVAFTNTIEDITITNLSSTQVLYYSPASPASASSFEIQPLQSYSFKCGKTNFYLYFGATGTCQLHGSYRN